MKFDPKVISYEELLSLCGRLHDPPLLLIVRSPDVGTQYRSAIFYHSEAQRKAAERSKEEFDRSGVYINKATTQIIPASTFYEAEDYHQDYFEKRGEGACHVLRK